MARPDKPPLAVLLCVALAPVISSQSSVVVVVVVVVVVAAAETATRNSQIVKGFVPATYTVALLPVITEPHVTCNVSPVAKPSTFSAQ